MLKRHYSPYKLHILSLKLASLKSMYELQSQCASKTRNATRKQSLRWTFEMLCYSNTIANWRMACTNTHTIAHPCAHTNGHGTFLATLEKESNTCKWSRIKCFHKLFYMYRLARRDRAARHCCWYMPVHHIYVYVRCACVYMHSAHSFFNRLVWLWLSFLLTYCVNHAYIHTAHTKRQWAMALDATTQTCSWLCMYATYTHRCACGDGRIETYEGVQNGQETERSHVRYICFPPCDGFDLLSLHFGYSYSSVHKNCICPFYLKLFRIVWRYVFFFIIFLYIYCLLEIIWFFCKRIFSLISKHNTN